jgi:hypothetical protein|tara:strand:+ start:893 stop:1051 length:159 start_codon:yes stop_codon:yes gene_type:complete
MNKEYSDKEKEDIEKENKEYCICGVCGKSTYDYDYEYLVNLKLHLDCALKRT